MTLVDFFFFGEVLFTKRKYNSIKVMHLVERIMDAGSVCFFLEEEVVRKDKERRER